MAKVIGIISIKGGVGKTSVVSSLGASIARDFNRKVLLIDANFSSPHLAWQNGIAEPEVTIHHVLDGKANIKDAIYPTEHGFDILPGAPIYTKIDFSRLSEKIRDLRRRYDIILIDSSPNLNDEVLATMMASDELIVITTPDHVTLNSTLRAVKIAKEKRTPILGIVLNKVYGKDFEISLADIEKVSGCDVLAVLPHEIHIAEALSQSKPSTLHKNTLSTEEFKKLAASLIGEIYKESGVKGFFRRLFHPLSKQDINRTVFRKTRIPQEQTIKIPIID
jgi:MinD-like ATPase involved in chromosome partitioning or flagellar assembly